MLLNKCFFIPTIPIYVGLPPVAFIQRSLPPTRVQAVTQKPVLSQNYKHHPVDKSFIQMINSLKPSGIQFQHMGLAKELQRELYLSRRKEYRDKTDRVLNKTQEMLKGLRKKLSVNVITLRSLLNSSDCEENVKAIAAKLLDIEKEKVLEVPGILSLFQKHWRRKKRASELNVRPRSLLYLERAVLLQTQYVQKFCKWENGAEELRRKLKDAVMKAEAYELFMSNKRVTKVLKALKKTELKLKLSLSKWFLERSVQQIRRSN